MAETSSRRLGCSSWSGIWRKPKAKSQCRSIWALSYFL